MSIKHQNGSKPGKTGIKGVSTLAKVPGDGSLKQKKEKISSWARMVVNPADVPPVFTPSLQPYTGAVRTFRRTFSLRNSDTANGEFAIRVGPRVKDTLGLALGHVSAYPANSVLFGTASGGTVTSPMIPGNKDYPVPSDGLIRDPVNGTVYATISPSTVGERSALAMLWVQPAGQNLFFNTNTSTPYELWGYVTSGAPVGWTLLTQSGGGGAPFFPQIAVVEIGGFLVAPVDGTGAKSGWSLEWTVSNAGATKSSAGNTYDLFDTDAIQLSGVTSYRVTALSLLGSYSGNQFNDGGVAAAARVPPGWTPSSTAPSLYESLTRLQDHSYRGALKNGFYVWTLARTLSELDPRPVGAGAEPRTELYASGIFSDPDGSLQLTVAMTVEFYSPLQIFEHEVVPPLTDAFVSEYHRLDTLPAATCNPKHTDILKGIIKAAGSGAKKGASFLLDHPEVLMMLLGSI